MLAVRVWQTSGGTTTGQGAALGVVWLAVVAAGILAAALFVRQAWPPPRRRDPPVPAEPPTTTPRRLLRLVTAAVALAWLVPLVVLAATALHRPVDAAARGWWSTPVALRSFQDQLRTAPDCTGRSASRWCWPPWSP